jgi:hypothetical protein
LEVKSAFNTVSILPSVNIKEALRHLALEMGGEAGARTAHRIALPVSADEADQTRMEHPTAAAKLKCREISHLWDDAIPEAHARSPEIREMPFLSQAIEPFSLTAVMVRRLTL